MTWRALSIRPYKEEVAENTMPALGLRMDGRARVKRMVRGGIIADQVGYGKTAITIGRAVHIRLTRARQIMPATSSSTLYTLVSWNHTTR